MIEILRRYFEAHSVDLVLAQSRGCRLLVEHVIGGEAPCWSGPVLVLSPAGEWGSKLAASSHPGSVLIAARGEDLVELGGAHPVLQRFDIDAMATASAARPEHRAFLFEEDRRGGWAAAVVALTQRAVAM